MRLPVLATLVAGVLAITRPVPALAQPTQQRAWVKSIDDEATWKKYSKTLNADEFGKFIIDVRTDDIYFIDVNLFNLHADFVLGVLLKIPWNRENIIEYNKNYDRVKPRF